MARWIDIEIRWNKTVFPTVYKLILISSIFTNGVNSQIIKLSRYLNKKQSNDILILDIYNLNIFPLHILPAKSVNIMISSAFVIFFSSVPIFV